MVGFSILDKCFQKKRHRPMSALAIWILAYFLKLRHRTQYKKATSPPFFLLSPNFLSHQHLQLKTMARVSTTANSADHSHVATSTLATDDVYEIQVTGERQVYWQENSRGKLFKGLYYVLC